MYICIYTYLYSSIYLPVPPAAHHSQTLLPADLTAIQIPCPNALFACPDVLLPVPLRSPPEVLIALPRRASQYPSEFGCSFSEQQQPVQANHILGLKVRLLNSLSRHPEVFGPQPNHRAFSQRSPLGRLFRPFIKIPTALSLERRTAN